MRLKVMVTAAAVLAAAMTFPTTASGATTDSALWSTSSSGGAGSVDDCGSGGGTRSVDANGFCVVDDPGAVELGVKFTSAQPLRIRGVRIYRVDDGTVTGSLWSDGGTLLARGTFAPKVGDGGWQDLQFATPVRIAANQTYVASYSAPTAAYAFQWGYFAAKSATNGPVTALQSTAADGNGVYCYVGDTCGQFRASRSTTATTGSARSGTATTSRGSPSRSTPTRWTSPRPGSAIPVKFGLRRHHRSVRPRVEDLEGVGQRVLHLRARAQGRPGPRVHGGVLALT